jgi:uncharacterized protein YcaQ
LLTLDQLRHYAVARTLVPSRSVQAAIVRLGFVQADPIRAPARAQDLILRHRTRNYVAGRLESHYPRLPLSEEMLHVYGFLPDAQRALLHPGNLSPGWRAFEQRHRRLRAKVLAFMREAGTAHPREVEQAVGAGAVENGWGSSSLATTLLLEALQRRGVLRVVRRDSGVRVYGLCELPERMSPRERADGLVRLFVNLYAPLPERTLNQLIHMLGERAPSIDPRTRGAVLAKRGELQRETIDGHVWLWPSQEETAIEADDTVRFLAPFDPIVWDRRRFSWLWGWEYRFEAYTPLPKRKMGYYALPLLWRDNILGWVNVTSAGTSRTSSRSALNVEPGFIGKRPRDAAFTRELDAEVERLRAFLKAD